MGVHDLNHNLLLFHQHFQCALDSWLSNTKRHLNILLDSMDTRKVIKLNVRASPLLLASQTATVATAQILQPGSRLISLHQPELAF